MKTVERRRHNISPLCKKPPFEEGGFSFLEAKDLHNILGATVEEDGPFPVFFGTLINLFCRQRRSLTILPDEGMAYHAAT